jgi:hypothetical protein
MGIKGGMVIRKDSELKIKVMKINYAYGAKLFLAIKLFHTRIKEKDYREWT